MSLRVVLDNSTLVGAAIKPDSVPDQVLQRVLGFHELFVSLDTLAEMDRVLGKKSLDRYARSEERMLLARTIRSNSTLIEVTSDNLEEAHSVCRDAQDDKILALCIAARADVLVSSDNDLLVLHPWRGIQIVTPAQFLARFLEEGSTP